MKRQGENKVLYDIVTLLCKDYRRRKLAIEEKSVSPRVCMEYVYLNSKIYDSAVEIVGKRYAEIMIRDIGESTGYAKSDVDGVCEGAYKVYKSEIRTRILKKLRLIDP